MKENLPETIKQLAWSYHEFCTKNTPQSIIEKEGTREIAIRTLTHLLGAIDYLAIKFDISTQETLGIFKSLLAEKEHYSQEMLEKITNNVIKFSDTEHGEVLMRIGGEGIGGMLSGENKDGIWRFIAMLEAYD